MMKTKNTKYIVFLLILGFALLSMRCKRIDDKPDDNTVVPYSPTPYIFPDDIPTVFPKLRQPADNIATVEGIELGRMLFYDPILSGDSTMSCATCHKQELSFATNNVVETGIAQVKGRRNSMPLINLAFESKGFFWDGRATTLEDQATHPVDDPSEMNQPWNVAIAKLKRSSIYPDRFKKAFPGQEITKETTAKALAQFVRSLLSYHTKFDEFVNRNNDRSVFTAAEYRGFELFNRDVTENPDGMLVAGADCFHCHMQFNNFQDYGAIYRNNGLDSVTSVQNFKDIGRGEVVPNDTNQYGKFKVPTLRNLVYTFPYMHDGRFTILEEVVNHYNAGGKPSPTLDANMPRKLHAAYGGSLHMTDQDKRDLVAFLKALTDTGFVHDKRFSNPFIK